ncbi:MAG: host attachment protein [Myxococcaceae bacterium]
MAMWILVGDEASARLFDAEDDGQNWSLVTKFAHPESRARTQDMLTDFPNHPEDGTHIRDFEGMRFVKQLADYLAVNQNSYQRLIIVGPPRFLGALRKAISNPVAKKLTDSLNKELTQLKERELEERLTTELMLG